VDATLATVTYGNGVVVVSLPLCEQQRGGLLRVTSTGGRHDAPAARQAGSAVAGDESDSAPA
jgi:hypothetical protein